jgi:endoglucanase
MQQTERTFPHALATRAAAVIGAALVALAVPAPAVAAPTVDVWWPTEGAHLSGTQPLKAMVQGYAVENYSMTWSVDGGSPVAMYDSYQDYPHDEAVVDVSGWNWKGEGPYTLTFAAKDNQGNALASATRKIYVDGAKAPVAPTPTTAVATTTNVETTTAPTPAPVASVGLRGAKLYVNPNSSAAKQAAEWRASRPTDAALMDKIAAGAQATWLGSWSSTEETAKAVSSTLAAAKEKAATAVFVAYNVPQRDCGSYSAGGANNPDGYRAWVKAVAGAIGNGKAAVILEPDALAQSSCLSAKDREARSALLKEAVATLKANANTAVYVDAGHSGWLSAADMSKLLAKAGIDKADGFALNVSNFQTTADSEKYGAALSALVGSKRFVVDTSRNGAGGNGEWCNPSGRALGATPTTSTGKDLVDAYLWIKAPGESDGTCNGGPSAGTWWPEYALGLASRAK